MEEKSEDEKVTCAANILLENKRKARKLLDEMNEDDRMLFVTYPIYIMEKLRLVYINYQIA